MSRRINNARPALMQQGRLFLMNNQDGRLGKFNLRELTAQCGMASGTFYRYFKSKDDLIRAAFTAGTKHFEEINAEINKEGVSLEKKLETMFARQLAFIKRYPDMPKCALKIVTSPKAGVLRGREPARWTNRRRSAPRSSSP